MKRQLLILGLILASCSPKPGPILVQPSPISTPSTTVTVLPTLKENPFVPLPIPSETKMPEVLPSLIPTSTTTAFPTLTPITWTYIFPIEPSNIADFSEGTAGHGYPATDIFAPEGSIFVAVTNGMVDFVSNEDRWNPEEDDPALRGGLSVAIIGEDGVRYYGSHLSGVEHGITPGVRVTAGQPLGHVGHTGDAVNTPSHLHFGISRPTQPEDWHTRRGQVDPFPFLVAWRDGHNVTPPLPTP
jgi:murein DD-endopeptidase MepM/ murein hydrolase activator NlpD